MSGEPAPYVCSHCLSGFVYALDWTPEEAASWRLLLRCPDCGSTREGVFDQSAVESLNDELDHALASILGDLRTLTRANMEQEVEVFVRALRDDLIGPNDF
jgi:DNA-directed RNA polymerase subunit RPC12/RpoP